MFNSVPFTSYDKVKEQIIILFVIHWTLQQDQNEALKCVSETHFLLVFIFYKHDYLVIYNNNK